MVLSPIFMVAGVSYDSWDGYWVPGLVSRLQSPGSQVPGVTYEIGPGSRVSGPTYRVRVSGPGSQPRMGPGYQVSGLTKSVYVYKKKKKKKKFSTYQLDFMTLGMEVISHIPCILEPKCFI